MLEVNKAYLGDCLEVMQSIDSGTVNLVLTDLPYGTTNLGWDIQIPLKPFWEQVKRVLVPNGAIVLNSVQPFTSKLVSSNFSWFKYNWIWKKSRATGHLNAKKQPLRETEDILVFYKSQPTYNPQFTQGEPFRAKGTAGRNKHYNSYSSSRNDNSGFRYPRQILSFPEQNMGKFHPTEKPIRLLEYMIKTYTNENDLVLDCCAGGGSTGLACINTKRNFILIEKDETYFEVIKQRVQISL